MSLLGVAGLVVLSVVLGILLGHLSKPDPHPVPLVCEFDEVVHLMGDQQIGKEPCTGPAEFRYVYLAQAETGLNIHNMDLCKGHIPAAEQLVDGLQSLASRSADS